MTNVTTLEIFPLRTSNCFGIACLGQLIMMSFKLQSETKHSLSSEESLTLSIP
jgi:hypothetical protein